MFRCAPFSLKHLTSHVQRIMMTIFCNLPFVQIFVDNIDTAFTTFQEHIHHCREVVKQLTKANLQLNLEKTQLCFPMMVTLGFLITGKGILPDPAKVSRAATWEQPKTGKDVEQMLGFFNYLCEFIPGYAQLVADLERIRKLGNLDKGMRARVLDFAEDFGIRTTYLLSTPRS